MQSFSHTILKTAPADTGIKDIVLLHGLFGTLNNWTSVQKEFSGRYRIFIPELPLLKLYDKGSGLDKLVDFLRNYIEENNIWKPVLIGNSLGGHLALLYALRHPDEISQLILAGSSGLYEKSFSASLPRIKDYRYVQSKVEGVFYRKEVVGKEVVDKVYSIVQSSSSVISIIRVAREARNQNLASELKRIKVPVLLIWGLQDTVTPASVAQEFYHKLPNARLCLLNDCGHVPMMEQPELFNKHLNDFLEKYRYAA